MPKAKQEIGALIDLFVLFIDTEMVIISAIPFNGRDKISPITGVGGVSCAAKVGLLVI